MSWPGLDRRELAYRDENGVFLVFGERRMWKKILSSIRSSFRGDTMHICSGIPPHENDLCLDAGFEGKQNIFWP